MGPPKKALHAFWIVIFFGGMYYKNIMKCVVDIKDSMKHAYVNRPSHLNATLHVVKADTSGNNDNGIDINADAIAIRSQNLFGAENADTFSRFIKFNVSGDGSKCSNHRFLIYSCQNKYFCGGWGDRLKGITSTFLLALLTNRTFLIDMPKPCEISELVRPNMYNWKKCFNYARTIQSNETFHLINTHKMDKLLSGELGKKSVVTVATNKQDIWIFRKYKVASDVMPWLHTLTEAEIIGSILAILFKPSTELSKMLMNFNTEKLKNRRIACCHIRTGKNPTIKNDYKLREGVPNVTRVLEFLKKYDDYPDTAIFVATDSMKIRTTSRKLFTNFISAEKRIIHVDQTWRGNTTELCDGFFAVLLDQLILARCDVLVLTRSNFGAMASYMRGEARGLFLNIKNETEIKRVNRLSDVQDIYRFV